MRFPDSDGRLGVFAQSPGGSLGRAWQVAPNGEWSGWADLGIPTKGAPAVVQNADGRVEVFAAGHDGRLGNIWQEMDVAGWWSDWSELGPRIRSVPVAILNDEDRLELFAVGPDGLLGHMWQLPVDVGGWSPWEPLGTTVRSLLTVFQNAAGHLELFAIGPDGLLGHTWQQPRELGGWAQWHDMEPAIGGDPVVFRNADGRLEIFAADLDGRLGHLWQIDPNGRSGWAEWEQLGPLISGPPAVSQNADGRLEVFAPGADGRLGHMWQAGPRGEDGWSPWTELEATISGAPAVFHNDDGRLEVFATGPGGRLGHMAQRSPNGLDGWSDWAELGPEITGDRIAVCQCGRGGVIDREFLKRVQHRADSPWTLMVPTTTTADFCVIGAGPAGVTVSEGLLLAGATVVMVESGGWNEDPITEELNRGAADGPVINGYPRYLTDGRSRQVQGAAAKWGPGWIMPFLPIDFEPRSWVEHSGWPISHAELVPYETQAVRTFGFDPFPAPEPDGSLRRVSYHFPPEPQLFRAKFLELLTNPRFRVELGATALELYATGDRIDSVRCARLAGGELRISADTVVLAAGGIENARLLLLSQDSLPEPNDMTGRCFMEHPHVLAGGLWLAESEPLRPYFYGGQRLNVLTVADEQQQSERLLNASVQLRRVTWDPSPHVPVQCEVYVRSEQAPNPESRVVLGERRDRFRCPQPSLQWRVLKQDWDSIVRTVELVTADLRRHYDARVGVGVDVRTPWPGDPASPHESHNGTWGFHHMGTTRMADDRADGVVDRNCLVHGASNLYVAGSSVFPTGSCANPTFTIVAMAHRLADHLTSRG
jgi:hypothetical protein